MKPEKKLVKIPQLDQQERIELQNIMLRLALEGEKIKNLENEIKVAKGEMLKQEGHLKIWKGRFDAKLRQCGVTIEQVDIDAETGSVSILGAPEMAGEQDAPSSG
ncbi:MAG: hypothetical protein ACWGQW_03875 [bacterium]